MAAPALSLHDSLAYARSEAIAAYEQCQLDDGDSETVTEEYGDSTVIRRVNARSAEDMTDAFIETFVSEARDLLPASDIYIQADTEFHLFLFGRSRPTDVSILIDWLTSLSGSLAKRLNRIPLYVLDSVLHECYKSPFTRVKAELLHRLENGLADAALDWARKSLIRELSRPALKLSMLDGFAELAAVHAGRAAGFASVKEAIQAAHRAGKLEEVVRDFMLQNPAWMDEYSVQRLSAAMVEQAHADDAAAAGGLAGRGKLASYNLTLKQLKEDGFIDVVKSYTGKRNVGRTVGSAVHAAKKAGVLGDVVRDFKRQNRKWKNIDFSDLVASRNKLAHSTN